MLRVLKDSKKAAMDLFPYRLFYIALPLLVVSKCHFLIVFSDMLTFVSVIFSLCESDIKSVGLSDILFAFQTCEANITWTKSKYNCEAI